MLDEHGTAIGLAFREDALEAIVGPLGDEFDEQAPDSVEVTPGVFELMGRMPLPEVCDRLAIELDEEEGEGTIGGHVVALLGRLPRKGDVVEVGGLARRRCSRSCGGASIACASSGSPSPSRSRSRARIARRWAPGSSPSRGAGEG